MGSTNAGGSGICLFLGGQPLPNAHPSCEIAPSSMNETSDELVLDLGAR